MYQHPKNQSISSYHPWDIADFRVPWFKRPKNFKSFLFWVLCTCLATFIKNDNANLENDVYLHAKNEVHSELLFWDIVEILQNCYFEYFENARSCPSIVILSPCRKLCCQKCWNHLWWLPGCKKITSSLSYFLRYCKDITNFLFWELWEYLTISIKSIISVWSKLSCLSACKKSTASLTTFLRCCREIANLLFWVIWACLATHT